MFTVVRFCRSFVAWLLVSVASVQVSSSALVGFSATGSGVVVSVLLMGSRSVFAVMVRLAAAIFGVVVELGC
jgi:hypothetical protein